MKYFYDTEFLEGTQKRRIGSLELPKFFDTKNTIDLISIGIVSEDNREYYAISKDFNLKEAWNRYEVKTQHFDGHLKQQFPKGRKQKIYWIRENVLKPIYYEWVGKDINFHIVDHFTYKNFKKLLQIKGKSNKQIAKDICEFIDGRGDLKDKSSWIYPCDINEYPRKIHTRKVKFYGYYSAYDHVALCWIFGKMIDLPSGFPMITIDIQQIIQENNIDKNILKEIIPQTNNHSSINDARWNKKAHNWIKNEIKNKYNK